MRGTSLPRRFWLQAAGAALLVASGAIHLDLYLTGYNSIPGQDGGNNINLNGGLWHHVPVPGGG